jgi:hypothetical protein
MMMMKIQELLGNRCRIGVEAVEGVELLVPLEKLRMFSTNRPVQ